MNFKKAVVLTSLQRPPPISVHCGGLSLKCLEKSPHPPFSGGYLKDCGKLTRWSIHSKMGCHYLWPCWFAYVALDYWLIQRNMGWQYLKQVRCKKVSKNETTSMERCYKTVILLQIVMVSLVTHLMKNHESQSRTNVNVNANKPVRYWIFSFLIFFSIQNAWAFM